MKDNGALSPYYPNTASEFRHTDVNQSKHPPPYTNTTPCISFGMPTGRTALRATFPSDRALVTGRSPPAWNTFLLDTGGTREFEQKLIACHSGPHDGRSRSLCVPDVREREPSELERNACKQRSERAPAP